MSQNAEFERMYERALSLLEMRDHSAKEMRDKLIKKFGFDKANLADEVVEKLKGLGLINDEHFARRYADELIRVKHVSPQGLRSKLMEKGIDRDLIGIILDEAELDPVVQINELLDGKFKNKNLCDEKTLSKVMNSLYRMGFKMNDVRSVINSRLENL